MNLILNKLKIPLANDGPVAYLEAAASILETDQRNLSIVRILSKSLDIRDQEYFFYLVTLEVRVPDGFLNLQGFPEASEPVLSPRTRKSDWERPLIVGLGPAGLFAALELIERGIKPVIFERGKKIEERSADVRRFIRERVLDPESNIQFGEGGAGSFSDGKLFSRRNNNSSHTNKVLETFVKFGAPEEILYIAKPHLGTDVLCAVVRNMRLHILEHGGEIHYQSKMTDLLISDGKVRGIVVNDEQEFLASNIFLALGHSARDTLELLHSRGMAMEQRPISVGVRIEHPVQAINLMRYGSKYQHDPRLGAATYSLNYTDRKLGRGVYTFCMCPGGEIVNASSEPGHLVLNGMSYSRRASRFSNAALVVSAKVADFSGADPLAGLAFQKEIERKSFLAGGGQWAAPAQSLLSFLGRTGRDQFPEHSYKMGLVPADLAAVFPDFVAEQLRIAFKEWQDQVPLFVSEQAILLAAETRTSSPVKILRDERFESLNLKNLHPIGEGSGYTGGITSSAVDAIKAVEWLAG